MGASTSSLVGQISNTASSKNIRTGSSATKVQDYMFSPEQYAYPSYNTGFDSQPPARPSKSGSVKLTTPMRGKPLIFAAMATVQQDNERPSFTQYPSPPTREFQVLGSRSNAYPSPPMEYKPAPRLASMPSRNLDETLSYRAPVLVNAEEASEERPTIVSLPSSAVQSEPTTIDPVSQPRTPPRPPASISSHVTQDSSVNEQSPNRTQLSERGRSVSRTRKSSTHSPSVSELSSVHSNSNGQPLPSISSDQPSNSHSSSLRNIRTRTKSRPTTPISPGLSIRKLDPAVELDFEVILPPAGIPLDEDPFAKIGGVKLLKPSSRDGLPSPGAVKDGQGEKHRFKETFDHQDPSVEATIEPESSVPPVDTTPKRREGRSKVPLSPVSPAEYQRARSRRRGDKLEKAPPAVIAQIAVNEDKPPAPFPLARYLADPILLASLLSYFSFYEWCTLSSVSKEIAMSLAQRPGLREEVLERYLRTVGYARWTWDGADPLPLSLKVRTFIYSCIGSRTYIQ